MKVSRKLIEKYHEGVCSPEEKAALESWLNSEVSDEIPVFSSASEKEALEQEMWNELELDLSPEVKTPPLVFKRVAKTRWRQAAAIFLVGSVGFAGFFWSNHSIDTSRLVVVNNTSTTLNQDLESSDYSLSVGPNSNVEINNRDGVIDFCGALLINPKKDLEFEILGTCQDNTAGNERHFLKKGLTYLALNYKSNSGDGEVIVLDDESLMGLPPLMKRQLMQQFNI